MTRASGRHFRRSLRSTNTMSRKAARVTLVEVRRIIAAARLEGARAVEFFGGAAVVRLDDAPSTEPNQTPDPKPVIL
jgi:hypothetical protein